MLLTLVSCTVSPISRSKCFSFLVAGMKHMLKLDIQPDQKLIKLDIKIHDRHFFFDLGIKYTYMLSCAWKQKATI